MSEHLAACALSIDVTSLAVYGLHLYVVFVLLLLISSPGVDGFLSRCDTKVFLASACVSRYGYARLRWSGNGLCSDGFLDWCV